ncbi:hypothetical protein HYC85_013243 [Camellia sinensis]|uniref:DNA mismatch repair proteins mutS family domain-containing protein n=1 Tax=Camellia sinensis TaxID=4442 RepID=A0A7J7H694_CAMSI|nr:hypothetical protein HYC85_013243 [Camellia sinensis]
MNESYWEHKHITFLKNFTNKTVFKVGSNEADLEGAFTDGEDFSGTRVYVRRVKAPRSIVDADHGDAESVEPINISNRQTSKPYGHWQSKRRCVTPMGRRLLRSWFLRPILDLDDLNSRLNAVSFHPLKITLIMKISFFLCSEELLASLRETLKSIKDIPHVLKILKFMNLLLLLLEEIQLPKFCMYNWRLDSFSEGKISTFMSICSLLHMNKIFEVGISGSLREKMKYLNLDIAGSCILTDLAYNKVIGVIDVSRSKDKGYGTIVKEGFCDEVLRILAASFLNVCNYSSFPQPPQPTSDKSFHHVELQLDELRQIYEELPEFLEEVLVSSLEIARLPIMSGDKFLTSNRYIYVRSACGLEVQLRPKESQIRHPSARLADLGKSIRNRPLVITHPSKMRRFGSVRFGSVGFGGSYANWACYVGYLMCVFEEKLDETTLENLQDFEFATRELDNLLGDIYHKILDMERAITGDLVSQILLFSAHLLKALNFPAELDCLQYVNDFICKEMTVDTFIPNDTKIHDDGRINIITGPNYSGKSIYIKQVALIVFLSHIGSFVPADAATVGLTDRHATSRSLCLLDEFGKGTLTEDGTGLLGGTINHFITCYDPPKVLVCTHLTEMFNDSCIQEVIGVIDASRSKDKGYRTIVKEGFCDESDNIKYYTMSVLRPDDGTNIEDIVFLYRLVPGHALLSYGVPEEVIKRAASLLNAIGNNNHVDRLCNDKISAQDRQYKKFPCHLSHESLCACVNQIQDTIDKMLSFDACNGDLNLFFQDIFPS